MTTIRLTVALLCVAGSAFAARWALLGINDQPEAVSAMKAAAERLDRLPKQIGAWHCEEESTLSEKAAETLQLVGHVSRKYRHQATGEVTDMTLLVGPAGPLSIHTPEVCLQSNTFSQLGESAESIVTPATGAPGQFRSATFQARSLDGQKLRIYYAWMRNDAWESPQYPRVALGSEAWLYKVQVGTTLTAESAQGVSSPASPAPDSAPSEDPCLSFLREFLPAFQANVAANPQAAGSLPAAPSTR